MIKFSIFLLRKFASFSSLHLQDYSLKNFLWTFNEKLMVFLKKFFLKNSTTSKVFKNLEKMVYSKKKSLENTILDKTFSKRELVKY